jgi:hypothetical protein
MTLSHSRSSIHGAKWYSPLVLSISDGDKKWRLGVKTDHKLKTYVTEREVYAWKSNSLEKENRFPSKQPNFGFREFRLAIRETRVY